MLSVEPGGRAGSFPWRSEAASPGNIVAVDIDDRGAAIDRWAAPFGAAVEAGEDDRLPVECKRGEWPVAAHAGKGPECEGGGFRRSTGQHLAGQTLARIGRRLGRQGLGRRQLLPGNV